MRNAVSLALLVLGGACGNAPFCDGRAAESALAAASSGDVIELGACEVVGPLHVPPGVTLSGVEGTVIVAPEGSGGVMLLGGAEAPTRLLDVSLRVEGLIGVLARGGGAVELSGVTVRAPRGLGLGASEVARLTLRDVQVIGPIDAGNADDASWLEVQAAPGEAAACPSAPCECEPGATSGDEVCTPQGEWVTWAATHGVFLASTGATFEAVRIEGFAQFGLVSVDSDLVWSMGGVFDTLGVGVRASGGSLELTDVHVERSHQGVRGEPPYGIVADDLEVTARGLVVRDADRFGVLLSGARGALEDASLEGGGDAALWITDSAALTVMRPVLRDNAFGGIVVTGSQDVAIMGGSIEETRASERPVGTLGVLRVGDGVHLSASYVGVVLEGLTLSGNERAGALVDLGAALDADISFRDVEVSADGAQLGAIAGTGSAGELTASSPAGWDDGVRRVGAAVANDAAFSGRLAAVTGESPVTRPVTDVLSVVAPMF